MAKVKAASGGRVELRKSLFVMGVVAAAMAVASPSAASSADTVPAPTQQLRPPSELPAIASAPLKPVAVFSIKTKDPVFFLTVDDGWTKQESAAVWVRQNKIPVTSFITQDAIYDKWSYFTRMSRNASVQNHTLHHSYLTRSSVDSVHEVCGVQKVYREHFGRTPWMLRPPFGDGYFGNRWGRAKVEAAAAACGIRYIVLWNIVVLKSGRVLYVDQAKFRPGDIVLLHYEGDLRSNLAKITALYAQHGLHPAPLEKYLPAPVPTPRATPTPAPSPTPTPTPTPTN